MTKQTITSLSQIQKDKIKQSLEEIQEHPEIFGVYPLSEEKNKQTLFSLLIEDFEGWFEIKTSNEEQEEIKAYVRSIIES